MSADRAQSSERIEERVEETHKGEWHKYAGVSSTISLLLPILSEFEGIGEEVMMGVGGAGAAGVFALLLKFGRVTSVAQELIKEQSDLHEEETDEERKQLKAKRRARKRSQYMHDPIGWCDSEMEGYEDEESESQEQEKTDSQGEECLEE